MLKIDQKQKKCVESVTVWEPSKDELRYEGKHLCIYRWLARFQIQILL